MKIETKKIGRPSKYETIDLESLKFLCLKGCTDKEISKFFHINEETLNEYKKKYPEFSKSLKSWKDEADHKVERSLYERACGYSHKAVKIFLNEGKTIEHEYIEHYPPDATSMIFWLKNRKPEEWREKTEVTKKEELTIIVIHEDVEERLNCFQSIN